MRYENNSIKKKQKIQSPVLFKPYDFKELFDVLINIRSITELSIYVFPDQETNVFY